MPELKSVFREIGAMNTLSSFFYHGPHYNGVESGFVHVIAPIWLHPWLSNAAGYHFAVESLLEAQYERFTYKRGDIEDCVTSIIASCGSG